MAQGYFFTGCRFCCIITVVIVTHFMTSDQEDFIQGQGEGEDARVLDSPVIGEDGIKSRSSATEVKEVEKLSAALREDAGSLLRGEPTARERRILDEDEFLGKDPAQRANLLLGYIRCGKVEHGIEVMSDLVSLTPKLLESKSGIIDLSDESYDHNATRDFLIRCFHEIEKEIEDEDKRSEGFLKRFGLSVKAEGYYLDSGWYEQNIKKPFKKYQNPQSSRDERPAEDFADGQKRTLRNLLAQVLKENAGGATDALIDAFDADHGIIESIFEARSNSDPVRAFVYKNLPQKGFRKLPKLSSYKGKVVEAPPNFLEMEKVPNLHVIGRDVDSGSLSGGVMVDGNFGYDETGQLIKPAHIKIIDHHDGYDNRTYDTATLMVLDILRKGETSFLDDPKYQDDEGRVVVMTNHLDSDSVLSTWALMNKGCPDFADGKIVRILRQTSICGDFLLGSEVMEYGATARDYEYIIRYYLEACKKTVINGRLQKYDEMIAEKERESGGIQAEIAVKKTEAGVVAKSAELRKIVDENMLPDGTVVSGRDRGVAIQRLKAEIEAMLGDLPVRLKECEKALTQLRGEKDRAGKKNLSMEENQLVLSHMHTVVPDIIKNPFKYQRFFKQADKEEGGVIEAMDAAYHKGDFEIEKDPEDRNILILRSVGDKKLPDADPIDGLYFFLRRRVDFNRELIISRDGSTYMMAINTQTVNGLKKYDFNLLVGIIREREGKILDGLIVAKETELNEAGVRGPKELKKLGAELAELVKNRTRNTKGELWRNRTQMIFAFKSYIPEAEFMAIVREWKTVNDQRVSVKKAVSGVVDVG